ncbi:MAG: cytochrome b/b6 domain-containing protein [Syntrophales bacterium]|jgi:formate dehydrogenase gamma subunit|nr:cytochrome b/b6 domain-containing protein [Syntrophales bacterium]MDY0043189.1 cytochrome b/b6 domain-containing protein [Syntrophales bacterium]
MGDHNPQEKETVVRHGIIELAEHWIIAFSGILLVLTGIFQLPVAKRYFITDIPGMAWSGDFIFTLELHYAASILFIAAAVFHIIYHGILGDRELIPRKGDVRESIAVIKSFFGNSKEPPFHKYLPEQRLAYAGMAVIIAGLIISGLVKVYKNIYSPGLSPAVLWWATTAHNIFFVLFVLAIIAHIGALILKPNRPMIRGIFTGSVSREYARSRHPLWIRETEQTSEPSGSEEARPESRDPVTANESSVQDGNEENGEK